MNENNRPDMSKPYSSVVAEDQMPRIRAKLNEQLQLMRPAVKFPAPKPSRKFPVNPLIAKSKLGKPL